jgi:hypothetical protein
LNYSIDSTTIAVGWSKAIPGESALCIKGPAQLLSAIHSCTPRTNPAHSHTDQNEQNSTNEGLEPDIGENGVPVG